MLSFGSGGQSLTVHNAVIRGNSIFNFPAAKASCSAMPRLCFYVSISKKYSCRYVVSFCDTCMNNPTQRRSPGTLYHLGLLTPHSRFVDFRKEVYVTQREPIRISRHKLMSRFALIITLAIEV